jgi:hypothetical protein
MEMAMKPSRQSFDRLKKMLVYDKMGANDGFLNMFKTELTRLVKDYFVLDGEIDVSIEIDDFGFYKVSATFEAEEAKRFSMAIDKESGIY